MSDEIVKGKKNYEFEINQKEAKRLFYEAV